MKSNNYIILKYFNAVLNNLKISKSQLKLLIILSFSQNISIIIKNSLFLFKSNSLNNQIIILINQINSFLNVSWWISSLELNEYISIIRLIFNGVFFFFYFIIFIILIRVKNIKKIENFNENKILLINFLKKYHPFIYLVFIQYTVQLFLPSILCKEFNFTKYLINRESIYYCGEFFNINYLIIILSIFQIIINFYYSVLISILISDTINCDVNKFSKINNNLDLWILIGKLYLLIWNIFILENKIYFYIYIFSYLCWSIHEFLLVVENVFIDFDINKFFILMFLFEKAIFIVFSLINIFDFNIFNYNLNIIIIWFVFIFLSKVLQNLSVLILNNNFKINLNNVNNKILIFFYLLSNYSRKIQNLPKYLLQDKKSKNYIILLKFIGLIKDHYNHCNMINCICKKDNNNLKDNKSCNNNKFFNKSFWDLLWNELMSKFNKNINSKNEYNSFNFHIIKIEHLINNLNNPFHSWKYLIDINKDYLSLRKKFYLFKLRLKIYEKLKKKEKNKEKKINIKKLIKLEKNYFVLKNKINSYLKILNELLKLLLNKVIDWNIIEKYNIKLCKKKKFILEHFECIKNFYKGNMLFIKFQKYILNDENNKELINLNKKLINRQNLLIKNSELLYDEYLLSQQKITILLTGIWNDKKGIILESYYNPIDLLGYKRNELKGMKIKNIIPNEISNDHDYYLNNSLNNSKLEKYFKINELYILNNIGFIVPVYLIMKPFLNFFNDELYNLILIKKKLGENTIITNKFGLILGYTESILRKNNWEWDKLKSYYIQSLIPKFFSFFKNIHINYFFNKNINLKKIIDYYGIKNGIILKIFSNEDNEGKLIKPFPKEIKNLINKMEIKAIKKKEMLKNYEIIKKNIYKQLGKLKRVTVNLKFKYDYNIDNKIYFYFSFKNYIKENKNYITFNNKWWNLFFYIIFMKIRFIRLKKKILVKINNKNNKKIINNKDINVKKVENNKKKINKKISESSKKINDKSKGINFSINSSFKNKNYNLVLKECLDKNYFPKIFKIFIIIIILFLILNITLLTIINFLGFRYNNLDINFDNLKKYNSIIMNKWVRNLYLNKELKSNNNENNKWLNEEINFNNIKVKENYIKLINLLKDKDYSLYNFNFLFQTKLNSTRFNISNKTNYLFYIIKITSINEIINKEYFLEFIVNINIIQKNLIKNTFYNIHNDHFFVFFILLGVFIFINFIFFLLFFFSKIFLMNYISKIYSLLITLKNDEINEIFKTIDKQFFNKKIINDNEELKSKYTIFKKQFWNIKNKNIKKFFILFIIYFIFISLTFCYFYFFQISNNLFNLEKNEIYKNLITTTFQINYLLLNLKFKYNQNRNIKEINENILNGLNILQKSINDINFSSNTELNFYLKFIKKPFNLDNLCNKKIIDLIRNNNCCNLNCDEELKNIFNNGLINSLIILMNKIKFLNFSIDNNLINLDYKKKFEWLNKIILYQNTYIEYWLNDIFWFFKNDYYFQNKIIISIFVIILIISIILLLYFKFNEIDYFYNKILYSKNIFQIIPIKFIKNNNNIKIFLKNKKI